MSSLDAPNTEKTTASELFKDSGGDILPESAEIARLSEEVEQLKSKIGDVLFLSAFVIILVIDIFVFDKYQAWTASVILGIPEIVFLFIFARACRVNDVLTITNVIFEGIERYKGNKGSDKES